MKSALPQVVSVCILIFSLLYFVFSITLDSRSMMAGDTRGWDPGSRALPMGIGVLMVLISSYLVVRNMLDTAKTRAPRAEQRVETQDPVPQGSRNLIWLTIVSSILYIALFRPVGFVISTNLLLFTLVYFYRDQNVSIVGLPKFGLGLIATALGGAIAYSVGSAVARGLFYLGRYAELFILQNRVFSSAVIIAIFSLAFAIIIRFAKHRAWAEQKAILTPGLIAVGVTEFLFLVFGRLFFVRLPDGLITW